MERNRKIRIGMAAILLACGLGLVQQTLLANDVETLSSLARNLKDKGARLDYHRKTGRLSFLGTQPGLPLQVPGVSPTLAAKTNAMLYLRAYGPLFGISNPDLELGVKQQRHSANNRAMVRYQQLHQGVPVIGGELNVNLDEKQNLLSLNGEVSPGLSLSVVPEVTPEIAATAAITAVAKWYAVHADQMVSSQPILSVYDPRLIGAGTFPARLVWRIEVTPVSLLPIREFVLVDAIRGGIALHFNQVDTALNRETYTANNTTSLPGTLVCNESDPTCAAGAGDADAVAAHLYAGDTYNFYSSTHGRDSLDNAGMTLRSSVHYSFAGYQNAFWNGVQMVYGDGFSQADDVVGHELTHGVTEHTSNLFYYYESGAINESLSDVWGEFIDLSNSSGNDAAGVRWQLGEDIPGVGAIRSMADPTLFGDPDRIGSPNFVTDDYTVDSGGVHTNSGVNNKAAYLMTDGDSFNGYTIYSMGITKVAKIYYEVQTNLLTSGSDYLDLYNALYQGCLNLVGTDGISNADCANVRNATLAVEMNQMPNAQYNPEAEICPSGQVAVNTFSDDLESGTGSWTFGRNAGSFPWENWADWADWYSVYAPTYGPYATSGTHSLFGFDSDTISDIFATTTIGVPNVSGHTPYLFFRHAFDFEIGLGLNWDGGVLEYSTNGGSTWNDAKSLINSGKNYNGTITNILGNNPLKGRSAFVGTSHGYVSTRANLNSLRGKATSFRWRVGTDESVSWLGWWLDDVSVYHCNRNPVASAGSVATNEDTAKAFKLSATDGDGDTLAYSVTTAPANGTLSGTPPNLTYTPNANFFGNDSLIFSVDDGAGGSDSATFSFAVNPVNDAPTITPVADQVIDEDTDTGAIAFTINDIDTSAGSLVVSGTSSNQTLIPDANIVFGGINNNRTVTVTPAADKNGSATIQLAVSDGTVSTSVSFKVTVNAVNDAPTAVNLISPANAAINVDGSSVTFDWDAATDVDGDHVSYELQVCEDVGMSVNCLTPVVLTNLDTGILVAGFGGNGILLLGLAGLGSRRRKWFLSVGLVVAFLLLSGCGGGAAQAPASTSTTLTGLKTATVYYWKVQSRDGKGGATDSAVWSFTTL